MKTFKVIDTFVMQPAFQTKELPLILEQDSIFTIGISEHRFSVKFSFEDKSFNISKEDFLKKFFEESNFIEIKKRTKKVPPPNISSRGLWDHD